MPHQMFFGGFDVLDGAGLEPLAVMRQARKAVLLERLVPENFDGEFSIGSIQQNTGMHDPDAGDDVRRFPPVPINGVAGFDKEMIFALVMPDGFGLGLREEQKIHFGVVPITGQTIQRTFLFIRPDDVAVDGEKGIAPKSGSAFFNPPPVSKGSASSEILMVRSLRADK